MKVIYYLYFIIIPIIFLYKKNLIKIFLQKYFIFGSILSVSLFLNIVTNYFNTGCLIYPMVQTCIGEPEWALPIKRMVFIMNGGQKQGRRKMPLKFLKKNM